MNLITKVLSWLRDNDVVTEFSVNENSVIVKAPDNELLLVLNLTGSEIQECVDNIVVSDRKSSDSPHLDVSFRFFPVTDEDCRQIELSLGKQLLKKIDEHQKGL